MVRASLSTAPPFNLISPSFPEESNVMSASSTTFLAPLRSIPSSASIAPFRVTVPVEVTVNWLKLVVVPIAGKVAFPEPVFIVRSKAPVMFSPVNVRSALFVVMLALEARIIVSPSVMLLKSRSLSTSISP